MSSATPMIATCHFGAPGHLSCIRVILSINHRDRKGVAVAQF
jgi:hypothetical protein